MLDKPKVLYALKALYNNGEIVAYDFLHMGEGEVTAPAYAECIRKPYNFGAIYRIDVHDIKRILSDAWGDYQIIGLKLTCFNKLVMNNEHQEEVKKCISQLDNVDTFIEQRISFDPRMRGYMTRMGLVIKMFKGMLIDNDVNPYFINITDFYSYNWGNGPEEVFNTVALIGHGFASRISRFLNYRHRFIALNFKMLIRPNGAEEESIDLQCYEETEGYRTLHGDLKIYPGCSVDRLGSYLKDCADIVQNYTLGWK